jgi:hypothetical protein
VPKVAALQASLKSTAKVEGDTIFGCQLARLGKLARFANPETGKTEELLCTPKLVDSLLALCSEDNRLSAHWTHKWIDGNEGIDSRVATWRNFRKDEGGNLVADAFLWPTPHKEAILHAALNDPTGIMVSMVFNYEGGRDDAKATGVMAGDFVGKGAMTTALLAALSAVTDSNPNQKTNMTVEELVTMLADPAVKTALKSMIDSHAEPDGDEAVMEDTESAAVMEKDAGVTDADKSEADKDKPAVLRAALNSIRALKRQLGENQDAVSEKAAVLAEAKFTKAIGTGKFKFAAPAETTVLPFVAVLKKHLDTGAKRPIAILRAKADAKSADYNAWEAAGRPMPAAV